MEQVDALINEANTATTLSGITVQQEKQSFITVSLFNDCLEKGRGMESPRELIKHVVVEHETTFLFGDTGLGKTILAIQLACEMAEQGKRVLYVNFELSDVQLAMRYPDKKFPGGLFVANVDYSRMHDVTEQSHILDEIQRLARLTTSRWWLSITSPISASTPRREARRATSCCNSSACV